MSSELWWCPARCGGVQRGVVVSGWGGGAIRGCGDIQYVLYVYCIGRCGGEREVWWCSERCGGV